jgi:predicted ABC-type ATPase
VSHPTLTIVAGANGAGKSTLTSGNPAIFSSTPLLDPDVFAKTVRWTEKGASSIAAARHVLRLATGHLERRESFAVETTLAGKNYLRMMAEARHRGFEVVLIYIGTESVELNLDRIAKRVRAGGHNVPESDVRRRYRRSIENLPLAVTRASHVLLFDNSTEAGYQLIGILDHGHVQWFEPLPSWATDIKVGLIGKGKRL